MSMSISGTHLKLATLYLHHGTPSNKPTTAAAPHTCARKHPAASKCGRAVRAPCLDRVMKQNLALSLVIIKQKVKVRRPPNPLLVEVEAETSCLRNLGQGPGNQVAIHPNIESNPLPRFCLQKEPHFALVELFPG